MLKTRDVWAPILQTTSAIYVRGPPLTYVDHIITAFGAHSPRAHPPTPDALSPEYNDRVRMKKVYWEILASIVLVLGGTYVIYGYLANYADFWNAQTTWSIALIVGYSVVAAGYYRQGWMIHHRHTDANISALLPCAVAIVQCLLFIKGVYFKDWSLIAGALLINSGVVFCLYQIVKAKARR